MAFDFHRDRLTYFRHQEENASGFVIPFIEEKLPLSAGMNVMEIGCGEGGVLKAFIERGCTGVGVELDEPKTEMARNFLSGEILENKVRLINRNIYDVDFSAEFSQSFDLIILKDVIEHIFDQEKLIKILRSYLKPGGMIFFGFPPWYMPFGGHQQVCKSKVLGYLPWIHLLPSPVYRAVLGLFGEEEGTIKELLEIKETGISIERFEKIVRNSGYQVVNQKHYLINPIYAWKFNIPAREQFGWINRIPFVRDFFTTCSYYLIKA